MKPGIWHRSITLVAALFAFAGTAQANLLPFIEGEVAFGGFNVTGIFESAVPTGGTSLSGATGIDFTSSNVTVFGGTKDFADVPLGAAVTFNDIVFNPSTPVNPLWRLDLGGGDFFEFSVETFFIAAQNDTYLDIWGKGTASGNGYRDTDATWAFSLNRAGDVVSAWASTTTVPEPGTLGLFGIALLAMGITRRGRAARA